MNKQILRKKNERYSDSSYPGPEDDIRENIINYEDEVTI